MANQSNGMKRAAAALALATGAAGLGGCSTIRSTAGSPYSTPGDPCSIAGYIPVKIKSGTVPHTIYDKAGTPYALMDIHDPTLVGHREGAVMGGGAGLAVTAFGGASLGGKVLATIVGAAAGAAVGRSETESARTGNLLACFTAINRGDYYDQVPSVSIAPGAAPLPIGRTESQQGNLGGTGPQGGRLWHCAKDSIFSTMCSPNARW